MPEQPEQGAHPSHKLESWKEIAAYLRRDVRTVRRWEKSEGLPVHRHVHQKLASVYAYKDELDAWSRNRVPGELNGTSRKSRLAWSLVAVAVVMAAAVLLWLVLQKPARAGPPPLAPLISSRLLAAATGEGQRPLLISAGRLPAHLALTPDEGEVIVSDVHGKAIHVISVEKNAVVRSFKMENEPSSIVITPDGVLYVAFAAGELRAVDVWSGASRRVVADMPDMGGLALTDDGRKLYFSAPYAGLKVMDTRTEEVRDIPTVQCPEYLAVARGKDLLFVNHQCGGPRRIRGADITDVRDIRTDEGVDVIQAEPHVGGVIAASPDGSQVWSSSLDVCTASHYDRTQCPFVPGEIIRVYRSDDRRLLATLAFPTETQTSAMAFTPDNTRSIVSSFKVRIFDLASMRPVEEATLRAQGAPVFTRDGRRMYLPVYDPPGVAMFDLATGCVRPAATLVSWWSGDGNAEDLRDGNAGELKNGAQVAPAWSGQGFALDGIDDFVHIRRLSYASLTDDFTLALWVKPARSSGQVEPLLDHMPARFREPGGWKLERRSDGRVAFCIGSASDEPCGSGRGTVVSTRTVDAGRWSQIMVVRAHDLVSLYLDGALQSTSSAPAMGPRRDREDLRMGADRLERRFFHGVLDEVQYYNEAFSSEKVQQLFAAGRAGVCYR